MATHNYTIETTDYNYGCNQFADEKYNNANELKALGILWRHSGQLEKSIDKLLESEDDVPVCRKIAYSMHEYDSDNPLTQLVRHTIEYLRYHEWASGLLSQCEKSRRDVQLIVDNTGRYDVNERRPKIHKKERETNIIIQSEAHGGT